MAHESHFMSVPDALKFIESTKARGSEFALHLAVRTYESVTNPMPAGEYSAARTWIAISRKQAVTALGRLSKDPDERSKVVRIGVSPHDDGKGACYWIG